MKIFWTKTQLQVVQVLFILLHFLWINYSLCGAYKQGQLVGTNVDVCLSYCTRSNTQHPSVQFCECILVLHTDKTASLLRTWRNTDVVGILKRPVNNTYMCQVMCRDLLECKDWHYDKRRSLCSLGNRDPEQTTSVAVPGWKDGMGTPKRNSQSNGVPTPTATGMSSHRGKSSPTIRTSKRNNESNRVTTPALTGMSSHKGKSSPNVRTSKRDNQGNGVTTPTITGMSAQRGKTSPNMRASRKTSESNGVTTPTITGMSAQRGKTSPNMRASRKTSESNGVTTPTITGMSAQRGKTSPDMRASRKTSESNGVTTPTITGMSAQRGKTSPNMRASRKTSESNGVTTPTITGMSAQWGKTSPNMRASRKTSESNGVTTPTITGMSAQRGKTSPNMRASRKTSESNGVTTPTITGMSAQRGKTSPNMRASRKTSESNGVATSTTTGMSSHKGKSSYMGTSKKNDESDDVPTPTATEISSNSAGACLTTCRQPNYICKNRKCVCNNGFSATTDGKCVKGCSSFKDSFTELQTGLCMRKFEKKYTNHGIDWCRSKCLRSDFECAYFEIYDKDCLTFKWKLKYYQPEFWVPLEGGCRHYTRDCNHKGSHCDVCDGPQYQCRGNKCVCSRGYSFVVGVGTCVGECVSYAHSFTKQSTHHCLRKYKRKYPKTTAKTCEHICRHEKKFTCGAFHIYKGNCYTMEWDMTLLEKTWERKEKGCEQYIRDCKPNCEMGYSLIPDKNRCVRDCKVYSTKFQRQSNLICYTAYNKKLRHVHRKGCERACLKYKKTCDGYELYKNNCYIIAEKKIYDAEWKAFDDECTHYQRICKE